MAVPCKFHRSLGWFVGSTGDASYFGRGSQKQNSLASRQREFWLTRKSAGAWWWLSRECVGVSLHSASWGSRRDFAPSFRLFCMQESGRSCDYDRRERRVVVGDGEGALVRSEFFLVCVVGRTPILAKWG